jgi:hypothetical protein
MRAPWLDRQLAAGRSPESSRFLASRAQALVSPATRRVLARDWEHLLEATHLPPRARRVGVPLCCDRITAAEPEVRDMLASLLTLGPIAAGGVAAAQMLLCDGAGPVYNRSCATDLATALREAIAQLDPCMPLIVST